MKEQYAKLTNRIPEYIRKLQQLRQLERVAAKYVKKCNHTYTEKAQLLQKMQEKEQDRQPTASRVQALRHGWNQATLEKQRELVTAKQQKLENAQRTLDSCSAKAQAEEQRLRELMDDWNRGHHSYISTLTQM